MLVLSLFPGIGLLDRAFEEEGFTVVRGPDVLWGGDVRRFHPPAGRFEGVIGGPPCQVFSPLAILVRANGGEPRFGNLIPEFERCVRQAGPDWWLMENVPDAPAPQIDGYAVHHQLLDNRWVGGEQRRLRRFSFGTRAGGRLLVEVPAFENPVYAPPVTSAHLGEGLYRKGKKLTRYRLPDACRLQGLPEDFLEHAPFTAEAKLKAVANGVPLPLGRAIAQAVKRAMHSEHIGT